MVNSGIFTTIGGPVQITGNFTGNTSEIAQQLNTSDASLYIAVNSSSTLFGTLVNVQNESRSHVVIYLEEHPRGIPDLRREILDFFSRCVSCLKQNHYSILRENYLLTTIYKMSECCPPPFCPPENIMHYTYGRLCVGKKVTCLSKNPLRAIDYLVHSIEQMPRYLTNDVVLAITKLGFGRANIIVTDGKDTLYQINLDEETIRSTGHPEYYKKFNTIFNELSFDDRFKAIKDQILLQYDNKFAYDTEMKTEYYAFLANEKISTRVLSLSEAFSNVYAKKEPKKGLISRAIGKNKSDSDAKKDLTVMDQDKILRRDIDYIYDQKNNVISLLYNKYVSGAGGSGSSKQNPSMNLSSVDLRLSRDNSVRLPSVSPTGQKARTFEESNNRFPSQEQYGNPYRNVSSAPPENDAVILSSSGQTVTPSGGNLRYSLRTKMGVFSVGDIGFHYLRYLTKRDDYLEFYTINGHSLELYSLLDETVSKKLSDSKELEGSIQSLSSYTVNPNPAKLLSTRAQMIVFICHLNDLKAFEKIPLFINNIPSKEPSVEIFLFVIKPTNKDIKDNDLSFWRVNSTNIISFSADSLSSESDEKFFETYFDYVKITKSHLRMGRYKI